MTSPLHCAIRYYGAIQAALKGYPSSIDLDPALLTAIILQESGGNPWAYNPEPKYRWFWNVKNDSVFRKVEDSEIASKTPPNDFPCLAGDPDQEWWGQQASWGLMQLMGAGAREEHFRGDFLTELCDPYVNIEFGIKHWWVYASQFGNRNKHDALLRWNGGNLDYPDQVLEKALAVTAAL